MKIMIIVNILMKLLFITCESSEINKNPTNINEILCDDDSYRRFNTQTDENDSINEDQIPNESSFNVPSHENLSVITEESSFIEEINSNDENNSIKILYDLIKKPHWTNKNTQQQNH